MSDDNVNAMKMKLGQIYATPGALDALHEANSTTHELLDRHFLGDWGDLCADDKAANDQALIVGDRILSAYHLSTGQKIWVITEYDRSLTILLLPSEY